MADQLIQHTTLDAIETYLGTITDPLPATHTLKRTHEDNPNSSKSYYHLSSVLEGEVEPGIGLYDVAVTFEIRTDKDLSTAENLHQTAVSKLAVGMLDPAAVDGLTNAKVGFTCYDILIGGGDPIDVDERKFVESMSFRIRCMMKDIV